MATKVTIVRPVAANACDCELYLYFLSYANHSRVCLCLHERTHLSTLF